MKISKIPESFLMDHTKVTAPFIRVAHRYQIDNSTLTKFDIRFCQPNEARLLGAAMHSLEHKVATAALQVLKSRHIDFSPMGCKTGFYWLINTTGLSEEDEINLIKDALQLALSIELVGELEPTPINCGSYQYHNEDKANEYIKLFLEGEKCE